MDFDEFLKIIPKIANVTLPAELAHDKMAPLERRGIMDALDLSEVNPRKAAVMMLFYPKDKMAHLVLIVRNSYPGVHSSQIAFPGGKVEETDESLAHTALRETHEEIGVNPQLVEVVRPFSKVYIPPSNFMVFPFLGFSRFELDFLPDPAEVADIIEFPLVDFLNEDNVIIKRMATSYTQEIDVPSFKIGQHIVWGATAMMLSELKDVIKTLQ